MNSFCEKMNELDLLFSRRSIRRYKEGVIEKETMEKVVHAGMVAPSAFNQQPWQFVIINEKDRLKEIALLHPFASMAKYASGFILVCADPSRDKRDLRMWPQDCAAATQNMLLAAHALELGAVWIGIYPNKKQITLFRKLCSIPKETIPFSGVCVGIPNKSKPPADRFDKEKIHWNKW